MDGKYVAGRVVPLTPAEQAARDAEVMAWQAGGPRRAAMAEIIRLENEVTQRRLRDAVLTQAGADWLAAQEAAIAVQRAILAGG